MQNHNLNILNKKEYFNKFNKELQEKRELNKSKKDIYNMSIKRPIPIDNYDYLMFNIFPKIHKEIFIKDLIKKNKRYLYKYLIGKIISDLYWDDYIFFLIEDLNKDIIVVSIYHFENKWYPLKIEILEKCLLSKDKYILFINPLFTLEHYEEILCFTTNEFILFNKYEEVQYFLKLNNNALTDDNYKEVGDLLMKSKNYDKSIFYYEKAIKINEKNNINNNKYLLLEILL